MYIEPFFEIEDFPDDFSAGEEIICRCAEVNPTDGTYAAFFTVIFRHDGEEFKTISGSDFDSFFSGNFVLLGWDHLHATSDYEKKLAEELED